MQSHAPLRILQVGLLGILSSFSGPTDGFNFTFFNTSTLLKKNLTGSCQGGIYLPGVDAFRLTEVVQIPMENDTTTATVYIGNISHPKLLKYCSLKMYSQSCPPPAENNTCYCVYINQNETTGWHVFRVNIFAPVDIRVANMSAYLRWEENGKNITLFTLPIPPMMPPKLDITLTVHGHQYTVVNHRCPQLHLQRFTEMKFCAKNLQNPVLMMFFQGNNNLRAYQADCAEAIMSFDVTRLGKFFFFTYADSCKRHGRIECLYYRGDSPCLGVTDSWMAVMTVGFLLTYNF